MMLREPVNVLSMTFSHEMKGTNEHIFDEFCVDLIQGFKTFKELMLITFCTGDAECHSLVRTDFGSSNAVHFNSLSSIHV